MTDHPEIKVLLIEDDPEDAELLKEILFEEKSFSFDIERADRLKAGLERLAKGGIDVVLMDLFLPDSRELNTLTRVHTQSPKVPIVILTGFDEETIAIEAIQKGAQDYLIKGRVNGEMLSRVIRYAIQRKRVEGELHQTNEKLAAHLQELQQRTRETALLIEIVSSLQACLTKEETYAVIPRLVQQLFPDESGAIFIINDRNLFEAVAVWGTPPPEVSLFSPTECWALKRGQMHLVGDTESKSALLCNHLHRPLPAGYLCVPMMAQGEIVGLLHLMKQGRSHLTETKQNLAITVAEHLAIASSSLKLRETLYNQSICDSLTGLFNRRYLEETLKREISRAKRKQSSLGIIMIDIDHFKSFNDTFGHDGGDVLLRELSRILQGNIRREDIACRYGGEEFVLILPDASLENTQRRAEQLREAVKNLKLHYLNHPLGEVTISLGVAIYPDHGLTEEVVLRAADEALYRAKNEGRDRVVTAE